jgi:pSer/pThr/pTyr-binding forkhead associated (FHA) protein
MKATVELRVLSGPHQNQRFSLQAPGRCLVGRAEDCLIRFSGVGTDLQISRRHCEFEFDPPRVQIRDLGSRNGTYLNGKRLEPTEGEQAGVGVARAKELPAVPVHDGDVVTLGETSFQIDMIDCSEFAEVQCGEKLVEQAAAPDHCLMAR